MRIRRANEALHSNILRSQNICPEPPTAQQCDSRRIIQIYYIGLQTLNIFFTPMLLILNIRQAYNSAQKPNYRESYFCRELGIGSKSNTNKFKFTQYLE